MKLFTLIHISEEDQLIVNNRKVKTHEESIRLYLGCALTLHRSLKREGIELSVLTNRKKYLTELCPEMNDLDLREIGFFTPVPSGIPFYSAHFKMDAYRYLSLLNEDYVGLLDSDMVVINPKPFIWEVLIKKGTALYYNISSQTVPVFGAERVLSDRQKLGVEDPGTLWAGGEFISGTPSFFSDLYACISIWFEAYFRNHGSMFHQGDEVLTSAAVESLIRSGKHIIEDAGALDLVGRYWSVRTLHDQPPFRSCRNCFLLHLPADKDFLAGLDERLDPLEIRRKYEQYLLRRMPRKLLSITVHKFLDRTNKSQL